ncbi:uncharacterized protein LOC113519122 [Galleria mellonella]|uniref:Uncharacterized protein LOC113519122 n=1 Tax=Galleria mellonella TaxID=7137 RepID=A0A6J1WVH4_GALME|nr:uncharacterized protein LOC113519122 [Galleria mellonella]
MSYNKYIILFLFMYKSSNGKINLNIKVASNENDINIAFFGHDNKLVGDAEVNLFNITKDNLNKGLRVELGKVPDDVFLTDPTPYYNLYEKYDWPEVKRQVYVKNISVLYVTNEEILISSHEHVNNSTDTVKSSKEMIRNVEATIASTWSNEGMPKDNILYDINIDFRTKQYKYENKWRDDALRSVFIPFGVAKKGYIDLKSGRTIVKHLRGKRTYIVLEVVFSAQLIGSVIADFAQLYGKYHFWAPSVQNIMKAADLNNEIVTKERIEIRCYTDPKLEIYDKETGKVIRLDRRLKIIRKGNRLYKII